MNALLHFQKEKDGVWFSLSVCRKNGKMYFEAIIGLCRCHMQQRLVKKILDKIITILKANDVKKAAIFGSFARGEATKSSDVDILIEFKGKKSLFDLAGLKIELEEAIGRKVDVVTYKSLHPLLKEKILSEQQIIL